jgi:hypothetical protein
MSASRGFVLGREMMVFLPWCLRIPIADDGRVGFLSLPRGHPTNPNHATQCIYREDIWKEG